MSKAVGDNITKFPKEPVKPARRKSAFTGIRVKATVHQLSCKASPPPSTITVSIDPVLDLIDAHRKAHAAHMASLKLLNRLERKYGVASGMGWLTTQPCNDENDAFEELVAAPATTMSGLLAKLAYLQELAREFETAWMFEDRQGTALALIESFSISISNISVQS
jgi:hypothetical protein